MAEPTIITETVGVKRVSDGARINPRQEDGHGSTSLNPTRILHSDSDIIVPSDVQATLKQNAYSTTTPLIAGASVTSPEFDTNSTEGVQGTVFADQDGTLFIETSPDGILWLPACPPIDVYADEGKTFSGPTPTEHSRVRYLNGPVGQGSFNLVVNRSVF